MMEDRSESQTKCYPQKGICDAQNNSTLEPVHPSPQHQSAKAIHCRLISVISTKAQAQAPQRPQ